MIAVVLVEDQVMVLEALATLLALESDIRVVGTATDGRAAMDSIQQHQPDVVVSDVEMPDWSGFDLLQALARRPPDSGSAAKVPKTLLLTTFARPGYLQRALGLGACGYILKEQPSSTLADAIRRVAAGERVIDPSLAAQAVDERDPFTLRERQVLQLAARGLETQAMAGKLGLSIGTIRNYLSSAMHKMKAGTRHQAVAAAQAKGFI